MKTKAIQGFKDILPDEVICWQHIEGVARDIFHRFGFNEIRLPVMEETELFAMRLAIINLTGGSLSGGSVKTIRYLVPSIQNEIHESKVQVFIPSKAVDSNMLIDKDLRAWPERDWMKGFYWLRREIRAFAPDAIYVPNAMWLNFGNVPYVVMVRNMEALVQPFGGNPISVGIKNLLRREMARYACRNATRIIAISQFVHDFLVEKWHIPSSKIGIVHHGIEPPISFQKTVTPSRLDKLKRTETHQNVLHTQYKHPGRLHNIHHPGRLHLLGKLLRMHHN